MSFEEDIRSFEVSEEELNSCIPMVTTVDMSFEEDVRSFDVSEEELNSHFPKVTYVDKSFEEDIRSFDASENEFWDYIFDWNRSTFNCLQAIIASGDLEKTLHFIKDNKIKTGKGFKYVPRNEGYSSPLVVAARSGMVDIAKCLLDLGLDFKHSSEIPPVHCAAFQGHMSVLQLLTSYGFRLDDADINGDTPLFHAAKGNQGAVIRYLVDSGSDVNHVNNRRDTILHILIRIDSSFENIEYIFSKGFSKIDFRDSKGCTPLVSAMLRQRSLQVITFLLNQGANAVGRTNVKNSPFFVALNCNADVNVLRALYTAGANPEWHPHNAYSPLATAVKNNNMRHVRFLVKELNVNINRLFDNKRLDAVLVAMKMRNWDITIFLLRAGYDSSGLRRISFPIDIQNGLVHLARGGFKTFLSILFKPRSLQDICTSYVRKSLGREVIEKSQKLQIPASLVDYVRLDHL